MKQVCALRGFPLPLITRLLLVATAPLSAGQLDLFTYAQFGGTIEISDYPTNATGAVVIPNTIEGLPVTRIGNNAFLDCEFITSVSIPESVTRIGVAAFRDCDRIQTMNFPPGLQALGEAAFYGCYSWNLANLVIPESITGIGPETFFGCAGITQITFHPQITFIGVGAFQYCGLTEVTIPPLITSLDDHVFSSCDSLTDITFPEGMTSIGEEAFSYCDSLAMVALPASLTAEVSDDLAIWTTTGVTLSDPDPEKLRTATVDRNGPTRFLRLVVRK